MKVTNTFSAIWSFSIFGLCVGILFLSSCQHDPIFSEPSITEEKTDLFNVFTEYQIVSVDLENIYDQLHANEGVATRIDLGVEGHTDFVFELEPMANDIRETVIVDGEKVNDLPPLYSMVGRTLSGEEYVTLTIAPDYMIVLISDGENNRYLEHLYPYEAGADRNQFIYYEASNVIEHGDRCGMDVSLDNDSAEEINGDIGFDLSFASRATCEKPSVLIGATPSFYNIHGTVSATRAAAAGHINNGARRFWSNSCCSFYYDPYYSTSLVWTNWPYIDQSNASTLKGRWKDVVNAWYYSSRRDLNVLFSGLNFDGSTIGLAASKSACKSEWNAYAVVEARSGNSNDKIVWTTAHEMGHLMGRDGHGTGNEVMKSSYTSSGTSFWSTSRSRVNSHWDSYDCSGNWGCTY